MLNMVMSCVYTSAYVYVCKLTWDRGITCIRQPLSAYIHPHPPPPAPAHPPWVAAHSTPSIQHY